jgi:hypothetical protein
MSGRINILAHRGLWFKKDERNTLQALTQALAKGYGLETDVRDLNGQLMLSHDMPLSSVAIPFEALLEAYSSGKYTSTLAINVKADGLQNPLKDLLARYEVRNYFVFDMSVPDTLGYFAKGMKTFVRYSELEFNKKLTEMSTGLWLDELLGPWVDAEILYEASLLSPALCFVSPELHGRAHMWHWEEILRARELGVDMSKFLICTDFPDEAKRFFE